MVKPSILKENMVLTFINGENEDSTPLSADIQNSY